MSAQAPLLEVDGLKKHFPIRGGVLGGATAKVYAVDGVSFTIEPRRDAVAGGRERLRQVHRRQDASCA